MTPRRPLRRSELSVSRASIEGAQLNAHVHSDHDVWVDEKHPEYFGCRTCLAAEKLEAQLDASRTATREVEQQLDRVQEQLEAAQRELKLVQNQSRLDNAERQEAVQGWQAERTKREEFQDAYRDAQQQVNIEHAKREVAENKARQFFDWFEAAQVAADDERTKREEAERRLGEALHWIAKHDDICPLDEEGEAVLASQTEET